MYWFVYLQFSTTQGFPSEALDLDQVTRIRARKRSDSCQS